MPINPLIGAALIETGGGLLSGLLKGTGKGKAAKELKRETKPKTPYYESFASLPILQGLLQRSILGAMETQLGQDTLSQWGINPDQIMRLFASKQTTSPSIYSMLTGKFNKQG